jgi:hypothetical protein
MVVQHEAAPFSGESPRGRQTDAARRAGDQHTFAIQAGIHIDLLRSIAGGGDAVADLRL